MNAARVLIWGLAFIATASFAEYSPRYYFNSVGVANLTNETVTNLVLQVGEHKLECDTVNHNGYCNKNFGKIPFQQDGIVLSWTGTDGQRQSRDLDVKVPATASVGRSLRFELEIHPGGDVKWEFRQGGKRG